MNKNSNTYTILYAAGLVAIVAVALAAAATGLKNRQQTNIDVEKKQNILASVNKLAGIEEAVDKSAFVERAYTKYIVEAFTVGADGQRTAGNAFTTDMKGQYHLIRQINAADAAARAALRQQLPLPVFVCRNDDGALKYILPVYGAGLWGALWGYLAVDDDCSTIYGATFDHKSETPGLGADIATARFAEQFTGKHIYENGRLVSVQVVKGGAPSGAPHAVDAISGGTITSKGVENMLKHCLTEYQPFFERLQAQPQEVEPVAAPVADTAAVPAIIDTVTVVPASELPATSIE